MDSNLEREKFEFEKRLIVKELKKHGILSILTPPEKLTINAVNTGPSSRTSDRRATTTGLAATTGNSLTYTLVVPAGATTMKFVTSGGTGDMDMYV